MCGGERAWNIRLGQLEMLAPKKRSFQKDGRELRALAPSVPQGPQRCTLPAATPRPRFLCWDVCLL